MEAAWQTTAGSAALARLRFKRQQPPRDLVIGHDRHIAGPVSHRSIGYFACRVGACRNDSFGPSVTATAQWPLPRNSGDGPDGLQMPESRHLRPAEIDPSRHLNGRFLRSRLRGRPVGPQEDNGRLAPDSRWVDHRLKGLDKCSIPRSITARSVAAMSFWTRRIASASGNTAAITSRNARCEGFSPASSSVRRKEKPRRIRDRVAIRRQRARNIAPGIEPVRSPDNFLAFDILCCRCRKASAPAAAAR